MVSKNIKWLFLLALALIWGSSFILIKKGLVSLSGVQVGSLRIIFAAIFLLLIGFPTLAKIPKSKWKFIALTSLFGTFIPAFLFAIAQTQISSSTSAVLNSLTPINTLLAGTLVFGIDFKKNQITGVFLGLIGCIILILSGAANHPEQNYWYAVLVLIASVCYAVNVNLLKKYLSDLSPLSITTGNFSLMILPAVIILFFTGFFENIPSIEIQKSIFYIAVLGIIGTGIANIIFFKLIQISSTVFATSVTYLIPIVAFFWGLLDHETLSIVQLFGAFVVLVGVYLASKK